jgi:hypothetical protein
MTIDEIQVKVKEIQDTTGQRCLASGMIYADRESWIFHIGDICRSGEDGTLPSAILAALTVYREPLIRDQENVKAAMTMLENRGYKVDRQGTVAK